MVEVFWSDGGTVGSVSIFLLLARALPVAPLERVVICNDTVLDARFAFRSTRVNGGGQSFLDGSAGIAATFTVGI